MYANEPQIGSDGKTHAMHPTTRISREQGMWIYNLCRSMKPKATLEIGMAYGFSTIYFLAAIRENGAGFHTAVCLSGESIHLEGGLGSDLDVSGVRFVGVSGDLHVSEVLGNAEDNRCL